MDKTQTSCELGFMIIAEDGRLADSGGDLKNQERLSKIFHQIKIALETSSSVLADTVHSITIQYQHHLYILAFEPRRSLVVKRKISSTEGLVQIFTWYIPDKVDTRSVVASSWA